MNPDEKVMLKDLEVGEAFIWWDYGKQEGEVYLIIDKVNGALTCVSNVTKKLRWFYTFNDVTEVRTIAVNGFKYLWS